MKVLHLITALETGGAETMLHKLLSAMDREAYQPLVVSMLRPGPLGGRIRELGVEVRDLGMRRGLPLPGALLRLMRLLRAERPDVVQSWLYHADLLALAGVRLAFPRRASRPALAWNLRCSFMDFSSYRRSTAWTVRLLARLSGLPEAVAANSRSAVDWHIGLGYHPKRFIIIPNGFDADRFCPDPDARVRLRSELGLPEDALLAGLVARFDPMKDHRGFARATGQAGKILPGLHAVCCGSGADSSNGELSGWFREAGLEGRVHLLGQRADVERVMAGLDVCVSSSLGESFPNVLGEALCCGVPCVATDAGDSALIVKGAGEIVRPGDPGALAEALVRLLSLPLARRRELGVEGRTRMRREYSLDAAARGFGDLYAALAAEKE